MPKKGDWAGSKLYKLLWTMLSVVMDFGRASTILRLLPLTLRQSKCSSSRLGHLDASIDMMVGVRVSLDHLPPVGGNSDDSAAPPCRLWSGVTLNSSSQTLHWSDPVTTPLGRFKARLFRDV